MDIQYIKKLLKVVDEAGIQEIEIEEGGARLRITRSVPSHAGFPMPMMQACILPPNPAPEAAPKAETPVIQPPPAAAPIARDTSAGGRVIMSPIVGTFYRAPSPEAAPFVTVGQHIEIGAVVCVIEAMKIMNEIESELSGRISRILVENGQPVEYNQPLFALEGD